MGFAPSQRRVWRNSGGLLMDLNASSANNPKHAEIVENLKKAYAMEIETVLNYIANSINLDGVRAREVADSLKDDVKEELHHARLLGHRLKVLHERVPGSKSLRFDQDALQPHDDQCDV